MGPNLTKLMMSSQSGLQIRPLELSILGLFVFCQLTPIDSNMQSLKNIWQSAQWTHFLTVREPTDKTTAK